jgi:flagellar hook-length control protein FliK
MQPVNVLPAFISQDTDLKAKESSGASADSKRNNDFSSLVEQHLPEENKATDRKESAVHEQEGTATQGENIASNGNNDMGEKNSRQESDSKQSLDASNTATEALVNGIPNKDSETDKEAATNNVSLTESEQFIALLYNSDQTLTFSGEKNQLVKDTISVNYGHVNDGNINVVDTDIKHKEDKTEVVAGTVASVKNDPDFTTEHKLKAFSKDELLEQTQLKDNSVLVTRTSSQALQYYRLSLQSKQNGIKSDSITSQQLMNAELIKTQLTNKVSDVATGVALASKNQLTERVDSGLYQLPVESIVKGSKTSDDMTHLAKEVVVKTEINQSENKASSLVKTQTQTQSNIDAELAAQIHDENVISSTKKMSRSPETLRDNPNKSDSDKSILSRINVDKLIAERNLQATTAVDNISKEQPMVAQEKQHVMTSAQLQALQQVQAQQKIESVTSEQQAVEDASNEFIDSMLLSEEKPIELSVPSKSKVIDNIAMRSVSELQAQTVQATQTKQSNDAYLEHQVSEVLNHNVVSDAAQIQKNNSQLQQETISIFRKDFADAVKDKVMMTINQKLQQFDITLDPPEFGNMQVRVNLQGEQASVNFIVQNQQAKDTLDQNMHKLRDMLSEQGVDVGDANVEQQNKQQNNEEQKLQQNNSNSVTLTNGTQKDEDNVEHTLSTKLFDSSATSVDYYA